MLRQQIEEIEATLLYPASQRLTRMPSAPSKDREMENKANRHMNVLERYREMEAKAAAELKEIEEAVSTLPPKERICIRCRYIFGYGVDQTCEILGIERRQMNNIKNRALDRIDRQERERKERKNG